MQSPTKRYPDFCGEPTADGDTMAEMMRDWYEANRETDRDRRKRQWERGTADNFMIDLMNEAHRIEDLKREALERLARS